MTIVNKISRQQISGWSRVTLAGFFCVFLATPASLAQRRPPLEGRSATTLIHWQRPAERAQDLLLPVALAQSLVATGQQVELILSSTMSGIATGKIKDAALSPERLARVLQSLVATAKQPSTPPSQKTAPKSERKQRDPRVPQAGINVRVLVPTTPASATNIKLMVPGKQINLATFASLIAHSTQQLSF